MPSVGADLLLLVADKNMEYAVRGLLSRPQALEVRPLEFEVYVQPQRDPGCALRAHEFLRPFALPEVQGHPRSVVSCAPAGAVGTESVGR